MFKIIDQVRHLEQFIINGVLYSREYSTKSEFNGGSFVASCYLSWTVNGFTVNEKEKEKLEKKYQIYKLTENRRKKLINILCQK